MKTKEQTQCVLTQDGKEKHRGTHNECLDWMHHHTNQSWDWEFKYGGWKIKEVKPT